MDGQMSIFDFPEFLPKEVVKSDFPCDGCKYDNEYGCCSYNDSDDYCVLGDKREEKIICKFSNHSCNKEELWIIAESFDDITCPQQCCRKCDVRLCGARCNGSEEPKKEQLKVPCNRYCDVEWCSIACFEKRGQIYDKVHREWCKDSEGKPLVREVKQCDWIQKAVPVDIKGICDDGYCPTCGYALEDLTEKCPDCGTILDWYRWKQLNS